MVVVRNNVNIVKVSTDDDDNQKQKYMKSMKRMVFDDIHNEKLCC